MGLEGGGVASLASKAAFTLAGSAFFFFLIAKGRGRINKGVLDFEVQVVHGLESSPICVVLSLRS